MAAADPGHAPYIRAVAADVVGHGIAAVVEDVTAGPPRWAVLALGGAPSDSGYPSGTALAARWDEMRGWLITWGDRETSLRTNVLPDPEVAAKAISDAVKKRPSFPALTPAYRGSPPDDEEFDERLAAYAPGSDEGGE